MQSGDFTVKTRPAALLPAGRACSPEGRDYYDFFFGRSFMPSWL
jgi:hypothetical protein